MADEIRLSAEPYVEVAELEPGTPEYELSVRFEQRAAELGSQSVPVVIESLLSDLSDAERDAVLAERPEWQPADMALHQHVGARGRSLGFWRWHFGGDTGTVDLRDVGTQPVSLEPWAGRDPDMTFISITMYPAGRPSG